METPPDYYSVLGLSRTSTLADVKKAYKTAALKYHPDKPNGDAERFKAVNAAYETLKDDYKRAEYNAQNPLAGYARSASGSAAGSNPRSAAGASQPAHSTWSPRVQKDRRNSFTDSGDSQFRYRRPRHHGQQQRDASQQNGYSRPGRRPREQYRPRASRFDPWNQWEAEFEQDFHASFESDKYWEWFGAQFFTGRPSRERYRHDRSDEAPQWGQRAQTHARSGSGSGSQPRSQAEPQANGRANDRRSSGHANGHAHTEARSQAQSSESPPPVEKEAELRPSVDERPRGTSYAYVNNKARHSSPEFNIPLNSKRPDAVPRDTRNVFEEAAAEGEASRKRDRRQQAEAEAEANDDPVVISDSEGYEQPNTRRRTETPAQQYSAAQDDDVEEISESEFYSSHHKTGSMSSDGPASSATSTHTARKSGGGGADSNTQDGTAPHATEESTQGGTQADHPQNHRNARHGPSVMSVDPDLDEFDTSDDEYKDAVSPSEVSFDAANPGATMGSKRRAGEGGGGSPTKKTKTGPRHRHRQTPAPEPDTFTEFANVFSDIPPFRATMDMSGMAQDLPPDGNASGATPTPTAQTAASSDTDSVFGTDRRENLYEPVNRTVPLSFTSLDLESAIPSDLVPPTPPLLPSHYTSDHYAAFGQAVATYLDGFCRYQASVVKYLQRRIDADFNHGTKLAASSRAILEYDKALASNAAVLASYNDALASHRRFLEHLYKVRLERERLGLRT